MTGQGQILAVILLWIMAPFFIVVLLTTPVVLITVLKRGWRGTAVRVATESDSSAREERSEITAGLTAVMATEAAWSESKDAGYDRLGKQRKGQAAPSA